MTAPLRHERPASIGLRFTKSQHLRKPAEFETVYAAKQRAGDSRLLVFAVRNVLGWTRIGLSVSKKHGGSVQRQRLKRLLREAFRLSQQQLPAGLDLVLIPKGDGTTPVEQLRESLERLVPRLDRKLPRGEMGGETEGTL